MDSFNIDQRLDRIEELLLNQKNVFNFDDVAQYTGLSKSHLYKLTSTGGIPCYKPTGKKIYFDRVEIDEWLLTNKKLSSYELEELAETHVMRGKL